MSRSRGQLVHMLYSCILTLAYIFRYIYALLVLYSCFTSLEICNCCTPVLLQYTHSYSCCTRTLLVLFLLCVLCACVCVKAYWPSRVCAAQWGDEERWRMGAWRAAAEGSWWSTARGSGGSCLCTDTCRCCAGTYSPAGAAACVNCGAGERCMSYDVRLPNLVSVRIPEEDARREYM